MTAVWWARWVGCGWTKLRGGVCGWRMGWGLLGLWLGLGMWVTAAERADLEQVQAWRRSLQETVFRDRIQPQWLPGGRRFWYRVRTGPGSHAFVWVDAEQGLRRPAFDHARLAAALQQHGVAGARPEALPLEGLRFADDGNSLQFRAGGRWWRCDLSTYALEPAPEGEASVATGLFAPDTAPRASRRTGAETTLRFVNRSGREVELFWLTLEGQRRSYGRVPPEAEHVQHTYAGHVWWVVGVDGIELGWFEATEEPTRLEIGAEPGRRIPPLRQGRRGPGSGPGLQRARWPDERWEAFVEGANAGIREAATARVVVQTTDGSNTNAYQARWFWAPDGRKLVLWQVQPAEARRIPLLQVLPPDSVQPRLEWIPYRKPGDPLPRGRPVILWPEQGRIVSVDSRLFPHPFTETGVLEVRWAPDSSRFTFVYNERGHQRLRVLAVDPATGDVQVLVEEESRTFVDYAGKFFLEFLDETNELIWMSERDGWNHLYLYDARTGSVKNQITRGPWVVRGVERVDPVRREIWFRAGGIYPEQDPYHVHFARIGLDGSGLVLLTEGDGTHEVEFSPDGRFLIDRWSRVDLPPVTELRRAEDGRRVCVLEEADVTRLWATGWRPPQRFVAKGRDGVTDIYGVIFRPRQFDPNRRYAVVEEIYAGPQGAHVPKAFSLWHNLRELVEHGFIGVVIDGMGTSHRSKAFHDVCWKNLGDAGLPDRIAWLRAAAALHPEMDLERVGIYGGSAGGQNAMRAVLVHGDFYRAAAADCGCHDNRMDKIWWNELWMGWPVGLHYEEQSNVTQAHRLQRPLLLTVGLRDRNVDPASTLQVVEALIRAGKDFEFIPFPDAGHGAGESDYGRRRRIEFFLRHLGGPR